MAFPRSKSPIKPKKVKKKLLSQAWCRGATAKWKRDYFDRKKYKKFGIEIEEYNNLHHLAVKY